jgi:uncharacterized membrane protein YdjX (TVP38/TMEM64 family)
MDGAGERRRHGWRLLVVAGLVMVLVWLAVWQPVAVADALSWGETMASQPFTIPLLIGLQALLLSLALPGTLMLWVVAPFYPPVVSAAILTAGSTLGALGAYHAARWMGSAWRPGPTGQRVLRLLHRQGDVWTQLALRVLPGFPHSVVNFGAGTLSLPLTGFLVAAAVGLGVKWLAYAYAVHALMNAGLHGEQISAVSLLPLVALAGLLAGGRWLRARLGSRGGREA